MRTAVFWDIDGTLLTTLGAGVHAWEGALAEIAGLDAVLDTAWMQGLTDVQIARELLARNGSHAEALALVAAYERRLPDALLRREGRVLPNVHSILDDLARRPLVESLLLTGNTRAGAAAKFARYGLEGRFPDGAFADGCSDRVEIAQKAAKLAERAGAARMFVVGDTPHDVACANAIGARCVAVATGRHARDDLAACGAWLALDTLPAPKEFARLLELPPLAETPSHVPA